MLSEHKKTILSSTVDCIWHSLNGHLPWVNLQQYHKHDALYAMHRISGSLCLVPPLGWEEGIGSSDALYFICNFLLYTIHILLQLLCRAHKLLQLLIGQHKGIHRYLWGISYVCNTVLNPVEN